MPNIIDVQLERYQLDPRYSQKVTDYLIQFGYIDEELEDDLVIIEAIKEAQRFMFVDVDGVVGPKTLSAMYYPRCGVQDIEKVIIDEGRLGQKSWKYFITEKVPSLTLEETKYAIANGFKSWSEVCDVQVKEIDSKSEADIILSVGRGSRNNFDGPGKTLAWCELAQENYRQQLLMFDADEQWVIDKSKKGILLENVTCHELGHAYGLTHSRADSALMAPFYSSNISKPQMNDDIPRIQKIYGTPNTLPPPPTKPEGTLTIQIKHDGIKNIDIDGYRVLKLSLNSPIFSLE